jgi:hypothetical protein
VNASEAIRLSLNQVHNIVQGYLGDLSDADLLVRPVPGANHIAWQLGHLIQAEHDMMEAVAPGAMPALPAGFDTKYTPETAKLDSPGAFHPKAVYLTAYDQQRAGTLKALEKFPEADLEKAAPEQFKDYAPTYADLFLLQGTHWLMHAGQWAVIRRKLGRKPLF